MDYLIDLNPMICERCGKVMWVPFREAYQCQCASEPASPHGAGEVSTALMVVDKEERGG